LESYLALFVFSQPYSCFHYSLAERSVAGFVLPDPFGSIALIAILALILGRRGMSHSFCWIAPYMIIGNKTKIFTFPFSASDFFFS